MSMHWDGKISLNSGPTFIIQASDRLTSCGSSVVAAAAYESAQRASYASGPAAVVAALRGAKAATVLCYLDRYLWAPLHTTTWLSIGQQLNRKRGNHL
jgi:hypothetical protein